MSLTLEQVKKSLQARITSMEWTLDGTLKGGWKGHSKAELKGMLKEAKNALAMLMEVE